MMHAIPTFPIHVNFACLAWKYFQAFRSNVNPMLVYRLTLKIRGV